MCKKIFFPVFLFFITAQVIVNKVAAQYKSTTRPLQTTIVYDIIITKKRHKGGIEETYNGGTKALFFNNKKARIRLVTLMRMQSVFFDYGSESHKKIVVAKESGKKKYIFKLNADDWKKYNKKYDSLRYELEDDSVVIEGYRCKKAIINLEDDQKITAYYTDSLPAVNSLIEPLFRDIPGTVLQYETSSRKGSVVFKASKVSHQSIAAAIFAIPSKGFVIKKYYPDKKIARSKAEEEEDAPEETE